MLEAYTQKDNQRLSGFHTKCLRKYVKSTGHELIEWYVYKLVQLNPKYISNDFFTINYSLDISDRILYL